MNENLTIGVRQGLLDILLIQGDTREIVFSCKDDLGNPIDLSSYGFKMQIRGKQDLHTAVIAIKTVGSGLSIKDHTLAISFGDETLEWNLPVYYYDVLFISAGNNSRNIRGKILITKSVTI